METPAPESGESIRQIMESLEKKVQSLALPSSETTESSFTPPTNEIPVSFVCVTCERDHHYLQSMVNSLPKGCEVVILNTEESDKEEFKRTGEEQIDGRLVVSAEWLHKKDRFDFATARNKVASLATREWVFWMDSDDRLPSEHLPFFSNTNTLPPGIGGVIFGCYGYDATEGDYTKAYYILPQLRMYRRSSGAKWRGFIHEQILPQLLDLGWNIRTSNMFIHHIGYCISKEEIEVKRQRNRTLMIRQLAVNPTYLTDYYLHVLKGNLQT